MNDTKVYSCSNDDFITIVTESSSYRQIALKLGYSDGGTHAKQLIQQRMHELNLNDDHFLKHSGGGPRVPNDKVFMNNSSVSQTTLRRRFYAGKYEPYQCSICGQLPIWNNKELVLTLDHIDGNHRNNELSNLRWVCPNCDRQLDTYGGRNR